MAIVGCALASYVVVKNVDNIDEVQIQASGVAFRMKPATTLSPEAQRERANQIEAKLEEQVRAAAAAQPPSAVDLTGTWTTPDGSARWDVSVENGYVVFREHSSAAPGVVTATGY